MQGVPDFCSYQAGADTAYNGSRTQAVRAVTLHRTQGTDSRALGRTRHHSTPGTFNFLVRDEATYCFYPASVKCTHAAGANNAGPGIEVEGFTGQAISSAQNTRLDQLTSWLADTYHIPHTLYDGPRVAVDANPRFTGFVNHNSVATEPQYQHTDRITPEEFAVPLTLADGVMINNIVTNALDKKLAPIIAKVNEIDAEIDALTELAKKFRP